MSRIVRALSRGGRRTAAGVALIATGSLATLIAFQRIVTDVSNSLIMAAGGVEAGLLIGIALGYLAGKEREEEEE
jgi:ABC-type nitrate/sulfonate/bicarbonate transport system permease component